MRQRSKTSEKATVCLFFTDILSRETYKAAIEREAAGLALLKTQIMD